MSLLQKFQSLARDRRDRKGRRHHQISISLNLEHVVGVYPNPSFSGRLTSIRQWRERLLGGRSCSFARERLTKKNDVRVYGT